MRDAMRGYLNAASGLTELTRKRAQDLAQSLLASTGTASGGSVAHQVGALAEELVSAARANRESVREMIRGEVEIAVGRLGLVPASELAAARKKIAALESAVADLKRGGGPSTPRTASARTRPPRAAVKKAATKASTSAATKGTATAPAKKAATKKAATTKAATNKAATNKAATNKAATKKAPAKKATS